MGLTIKSGLSNFEEEKKMKNNKAQIITAILISLVFIAASAIGISTTVFSKTEVVVVHRDITSYSLAKVSVSSSSGRIEGDDIIAVDYAYYNISSDTNNIVMHADDEDPDPSEFGDGYLCYEKIGRKYAVTAYNPYCKHCCGKTDAITASGRIAEDGKSVAMADLPFGTIIYVEDYGYFRVDDRGPKKNVIDIAVCDKSGSHDGCYAYTHSTADLSVWIVTDPFGENPW